MNKKLLAVAIAAAAFGTQAVAVELYNNDGTTFSVGGHVSVNLNGSEQGDTDVGANSPRINFNATQDLGNGFTADARGEWAINYLDGGEDTFTTRLGYIGVTHDELGRAVVGTQWAPYYDVAGVTDMPIAFANDFLYELHGELGTGRADNMVSYRNGFDFGEAGELKFGLGWQGKQTTTYTDEDVLPNGDIQFDRYDVRYGDRTQATLSYSIMGVTAGYAYNTGDLEGESLDFNTFSLNYGSYGKGLYLAGVYQMMEVADFEQDSYELLAAYALANSLNFSVNYENVEEKEKGFAKETAREEMALQVEYNFTPKFVGYTGYQFDLNDDNGRKTDDKWTIGGRYYL
ncbi:porin [Vibrio maerlii]|uniref:porin n=1 Tax=Vibrio maerlii TaxID=2231648 RepID=UPI000E3E169C|nr:porin [Vibrio maerlii]